MKLVICVGFIWRGMRCTIAFDSRNGVKGDDGTAVRKDALELARRALILCLLQFAMENRYPRFLKMVERPAFHSCADAMGALMPRAAPAPSF
jgi:hypothetical protein